MDGFTVSIVTAIVTVIISFFIAFVIKFMVILLDKLSKPVQQVETESSTQGIELDDETDIAAVIAIASSQSK